MATEPYSPDSAVSVVNKSPLRPGQLSLYELIVKKLEKQDTLTLDEAEHIWKTKVHGNMIDGKPYRTDYYLWETRSWNDSQVPMQRFEIEFAVMNWLMKNIGLLVIRGYLKVIPTISLKELKETTPQ